MGDRTAEMEDGATGTLRGEFVGLGSWLVSWPSVQSPIGLVGADLAWFPHAVGGEGSPSANSSLQIQRRPL